MRYGVLLLVVGLGACGDGAAQTGRAFVQTGVIEGFYGSPWSHQDRLDVLRFMGRVGLTHYYYAPKDDPYHRERWREPYPVEQTERLAELVATARASGVTFVYAISPGGSMVHSDSSEYRELRTKLAAIGTLGVADFALFLDDVPPTLQHARDRQAFGSLADAHAALINRLHADLSAAGATLAVTPTTYTDAWGDRDYLRRLGELVDADVPLFWTGIDVASPDITADQANHWAALTARPPLVWDNYPVNDYARWRLFLGPLRHRAPDLPDASLGILANPMNEAHASMIPLATLAEYARDPVGYNPDSALGRATSAVYGAEIARILDPFLDIYGDYAEDTNLFEPLFIPGEAIDRNAIAGGLARLESAMERLDSVARARPDAGVLANELRPFVTRTRERLAEIQADSRYAAASGQLAFRTELDRVIAERNDAPVTVDGRLDDWAEARWRALHGSSGRAAPRVAVRSDSLSLYLALRVPHPPQNVNRSPRIGEGDHVALVIQGDPQGPRTCLTPDDIVVLIAPPPDGADLVATQLSMGFRGFMAKWLADNRNLTFSEFHVTTFGAEPPVPKELRAAGVHVADGYTVEIAIPHRGLTPLRLSLSVAATLGGARRYWSLAERSYPANPATFSEIVIGR
jgi:hypothetical protein